MKIKIKTLYVPVLERNIKTAFVSIYIKGCTKPTSTVFWQRYKSMRKRWSLQWMELGHLASHMPKMNLNLYLTL